MLVGDPVAGNAHIKISWQRDFKAGSGISCVIFIQKNL